MLTVSAADIDLEPILLSTAQSATAAVAAYLQAPAYRVGELVGLDEAGATFDESDLMRNLGLKSVSRISGDPFDVIMDCTQDTLASASIPAAEVDAVIFATSTLAQSANVRLSPHTGSRFEHMLKQKGLLRAIPIGLGLGQCLNLSTGISIAAALVSAKRYRNVLVLSADVVAPDLSRIIEPGTMVLGDAAATCLITDQPSGWEMIGFAEQFDGPGQGVGPDSRFLTYLKNTAAGIGRVCADLYQQLGVSAEHFEQVLTNNVNLSAARLFADSAGVAPQILHTANISRYGHCHAADIIINLCDYVQSQTAPTSSELLMLLGCAPGAYRAAALRCRVA